ncbi:MAG: hypothetical protein V9G12_08330 [Microthrixaceae bacterium]
MLNDLGRCEPGAQRQRDYPASRGSGDQVERLADADTKVLLQPCEHMSGEEGLGAAAVQCQYLERL